MKALELADYCESLAREIDHSHFTHDLIAAAAELRRLAAVEAELERIKALEPVAWCLGNPEFADSSNVFLANEFTPDGEHEDEWTALYALGSKTA